MWFYIWGPNENPASPNSEGTTSVGPLDPPTPPWCGGPSGGGRGPPSHDPQKSSSAPGPQKPLLLLLGGPPGPPRLLLEDLLASGGFKLYKAYGRTRPPFAGAPGSRGPPSPENHPGEPVHREHRHPPKPGSRTFPEVGVFRPSLPVNPRPLSVNMSSHRWWGPEAVHGGRPAREPPGRGTRRAS
ncbi:collagen alpha-1(III) chain-like [Penaeus monodon]|uniref:collagen alpha-1(III) chain-like n=1 Tax=Penaeus monodon TaxID=6687 RepID=UPI0018A6F49B|nr:collagen alpha-1(III) chain-like [Penaeus monodon]